MSNRFLFRCHCIGFNARQAFLSGYHSMTQAHRFLFTLPLAISHGVGRDPGSVSWHNRTAPSLPRRLAARFTTQLFLLSEPCGRLMECFCTRKIDLSCFHWVRFLAKRRAPNPPPTISRLPRGC